MGGFQFNGCGARDYFKKMMYIGDQMCPICQRVTPFYLEKGKFKISVFWIPTITLKERYAILCDKCKQGKWIEENEMYKIMAGQPYVVGEIAKPIVVGKCSQCGAEIDGVFCSNCGARNDKPENSQGISNYIDNAESVAASKRICSNCGDEVESAFCRNCGTKYAPPLEQATVDDNKCSNCGAEVRGKFCTECGKPL